MTRFRMLGLFSVAAALASTVSYAGGNPPAGAPDPAGVSPKPIVAKDGAGAARQAVDETLVRDLKGGGYVLFFRHGMTSWQERDQATEGNFADRSLQRNLSEAGRAEAIGIGKAVSALQIPIERVLASPMWRCRDTADLAFGRCDTTGDLFFKGPKYRDARIKMLSTAPAKGKNLVLVGHQDQLIPIVPGLRRDELKEGDALVFRPLGDGKYRVVAQVTPADWARLAGLPPPAAGSSPPAGASMPALADSAQGR
jgi:phosphohistidine phosphatase SixA